MTKHRQYQAYRAATETVAPARQIILLYEGIIRFMQQAREAVEKKNIPERYNLLVKAGEIVMGLQNSLDFETGGDIARILHDFYARVDMEILSIHRSNSITMCDHVIRQLKQMRDAWARVEQMRAQSGEQATGQSMSAAAILTTEALATIALSA